MAHTIKKARAIAIDCPKVGLYRFGGANIYQYDYTNSCVPFFDATNDAIDYLGERWAELRERLREQDQNKFAKILRDAGIDGFPIRAVYNHVWGWGAWID